MSEFIEVLSPSALKDLQTLNTMLAETIKNVKVVNENMIGAKTPSGSDSAVKALNDAYKQQEATIRSLQQQLSKLQAQNSLLASSQNNLRTSTVNQKNATREQAVAQQILRAETDRNIRANTLLGGAYARASAQLLILKKEAKDAAIAFGEESKQAITAAKAASDLDQRIKSADKSVGDFQRNVGNYSGGIVGGFQKVFSSVRQLAYILPGIGIAGIFSLALDPLFELIKGMDIFKDKLISIKEMQKVNQEAAKSSGEEIANMKALISVAKDDNLSREDRLIAVKDLQKEYPAYFGNLSTEKILNEDLTSTTKELTNAIIARAKATAYAGKIGELSLQKQEIEDKITNEIERQNKLTKEAGFQVYNTNKIILDVLSGHKKIGDVINKNGTREQYLASIQADAMLRSNTELKALGVKLRYNNSEQEKYTKNIEETTKASIKLHKTDDTKKEEKNKREKETAIELKNAYEGLLVKLKEFRDAFAKQRDETSLGREEYDRLNESVKYYQGLIDALTKEYDTLSESAKKATDQFENVYGHRAQAQVIKMAKETRDWINSFNTGFLSGAGVGALDMFFRKAENGRTVFQNLFDDAQKVGEGWKVTFLGLSQVAEESYAFLEKFGQQNYEASYARLEAQKEIAIKFAGESTSAQEEINRQYDERRKKIDRQKAEQEKKSAIFKAIIDTAQAVVSALPNIPLSIAVGLIGAAQIALIESQQVPAFAVGTDNAPEGWALTQEKGAEIITDRNGKVKSLGSNKGAQYTYLNKGDKVYTAEQTEALMFNREFNNLMTNNGIGMPIVNVVNDNSNVVNEIKALRESISNNPSLIINKDERGERVFIRKQAETKQLLNNHLTYRGYDI